MKMQSGVNYKSIERDLLLIAGKFLTISNSERSPFKGHNFMTENIVITKKLENGIWFELSYGRFVNDWIFGITLTDNKGTDFEDVQGCCYEFKEVEEILRKVDNYVIKLF